MNYLLIWLLAGNIGMNFLWARNNNYRLKEAWFGFAFGCLLGPLAYPFGRFLNEIK